jgi:predicted hotdog family 3-hydroxylacyl-ACP dehydratase
MCLIPSQKLYCSQMGRAPLTGSNARNSISASDAFTHFINRKRTIQATVTSTNDFMNGSSGVGLFRFSIRICDGEEFTRVSTGEAATETDSTKTEQS